MAVPLAEALAALAEEETAAKGRPQIKVVVKGGSRTLPPRIEAGLYRVAREALSNVVRHANARLYGDTNARGFGKKSACNQLRDFQFH